MSCGIDLCPAGTVGGIAVPEAAPAVIMRGGAYAQQGTAVEPYGCNLAVGQKGGACPCLNSALGTFRRGGYSGSRSASRHKGGYRATKKDKAALKRFRAGKSIGFTMTASLKAKGLINRANGTRRISAKYQGGNRGNK